MTMYRTLSVDDTDKGLLMTMYRTLSVADTDNETLMTISASWYSDYEGFFLYIIAIVIKNVDYSTVTITCL